MHHIKSQPLINKKKADVASPTQAGPVARLAIKLAICCKQDSECEVWRAVVIRINPLLQWFAWWGLLNSSNELYKESFSDLDADALYYCLIFRSIRIKALQTPPNLIKPSIPFQIFSYLINILKIGIYFSLSKFLCSATRLSKPTFQNTGLNRNHESRM